ncbi:LruC domain-containing protein [Parabacteroides sp.]
MKRGIFVKVKFLALFLFAALMAACTADVYEPKPDPTPDPDPNPGQGGDLPKDFTWSLSNDTELSVNIEGIGEEKYIVEAYVGNPAIDSKALLIAGSQQKVNNKIPYKRMITLPDGLETLYLRITDNRQRVGVYAFDVAKDQMVCTIGDNGIKTKSAAMEMRSSTGSMPTIDYSYAGKEYTELSGNKKTDLKKSSVYVIPKGKTFSGSVSMPGEGDLSIYVEGTWQVVDNNMYLQHGTFVYVLSGGKMETTKGNADLTLKQNSQIAVQKGGEFGDDDNKNLLNLYLTNFTSVVNEGDLYAKDIDLDAEGSLYNAGDFDVENLTCQNAGNYILNMHEFDAKHVSMTNGVIDNYCQFESEKLDVVANGVINVAPHGYMDVKHLDAKGLTLFMDAKAMWKGEKASFSDQISQVKGGSTDYALFKVENIDAKKTGGTVLAYSGKLNIDADHHTVNGQWDKYYTMTSDVVFSEGQGFVEIDDDDCNGNNGNHNPGTEPDDPDGDITEGNTMPYTYMFEDNWPGKGDYDMNDIVISVTMSNTTTAEGKLKAVDIVAKLHAVGATKKLAVAFQLDGMSRNDVASDVEANQSRPVIRLFDDAHAEMGVPAGTITNTYNYDKSLVKEIHKHIDFNETLSTGVNVGKFNLFVIWGDPEANLRNEIHLPGFYGTDKAAKNASCTDNYMSTEDGWMWGLAVPEMNFGSFPKETIHISEAYSGFGAWMAGQDTPNWYMNPIEGKVIITEDVPEVIE